MHIDLLVLSQKWSLKIIGSLFGLFTGNGVVIGPDLATLFVAVPYVYLTKCFIQTKISECLLRLSLVSNDRSIPSNFEMYKERWTVDTFQAKFANGLEQFDLSRKLMDHFIRLDTEHRLVTHGLHLLTNPDLLPWATNFEGVLSQKFKEHAHSKVLAELKLTLEIGKSVNDNPSLRNFSTGCLGLLNFIEQAEPLIASIYGEEHV